MQEPCTKNKMSLDQAESDNGLATDRGGYEEERHVGVKRTEPCLGTIPEDCFSRNVG